VKLEEWKRAEELLKAEEEQGQPEASAVDSEIEQGREKVNNK
jgi:hypothetical protein